MTSSASPLTPVEAAVQIRTAYRLLNAYHRRLLDLLATARDAVRARFGHRWEAGGDTLHLGGFSLDVTAVWTGEQLTNNLVAPLLDLITEVRAAVPASAGRGRGRRA